MKAINLNKAAGVTLLEVLMAIVIFAIGMLALVQLQGKIGQSSSDSNSRTVATNIAEEIIEHARSFVQLAADPNGVLNTYADIVDDNRTYLRGGVNYDVAIDVTDYWFDSQNREQFWSPDDDVSDPEYMSAIFDGVLYSDFKHVAVTVTWAENPELFVDQIDRSNPTTATVGTGSILLTQAIPSYPPLSGLMTAAVGNSSSDGGGVPVNYVPGENPDILPITVDGANNRFKESSTPLPEIRRGGEVVETWMDVITYNQALGGDATFLRREEFLAVSCECLLRIPTADDQGGLRPTVWTGLEYRDGEFVSKPYGEVASTNQSAYCEQCCANHHDDETDTSASASYDATRNKVYWDSGPLAGDHEHWGYNDAGVLVLADSDGDHYEEACRMIRVNGWFRVAQDAQLQELLAFPEGYLDFTPNAQAYSGYVVGAVEDWYVNAPLSLVEPSTPFPAVSQPDAAPIPYPTPDWTSQQLRARGIYIDYLTPEAQEIADCLYAGGSGDDCEAPGISSWLEVYPFFDAQLTWLARWNEDPPDITVDVTNQPVATDNTHDRGRAVLQVGGTGFVEVIPEIHRGNLGLTSTEAIDNNYVNEIDDDYTLWMLASQDVTAPLVEGDIIISGSITSGVGGVKASNIDIRGSNALCKRNDVGYACLVQTGGGGASLTVSNYYKANQDLYACSASLGISSQSIGSAASTTFTLPVEGDGFPADIVIQNRPCGA